MKVCHVLLFLYFCVGMSWKYCTLPLSPRIGMSSVFRKHFALEGSNDDSATTEPSRNIVDEFDSIHKVTSGKRGKIKNKFEKFQEFALAKEKAREELYEARRTNIPPVNSFVESTGKKPKRTISILSKNMKSKKPSKKKDVNMDKPDWTEETFFRVLDDPMYSGSPSIELVQEPERFPRHFLAFSEIKNGSMFSLRMEAWFHHMQWMRRSALRPRSDLYNINEPESLGYVVDAYTGLSKDSLFPLSQVLIVQSDSFTNFSRFLATEPLARYGGVVPWRMFEIEFDSHSNLTHDFRTPYLHIGWITNSTAMAAMAAPAAPAAPAATGSIADPCARNDEQYATLVTEIEKKIEQSRSVHLQGYQYSPCRVARFGKLYEHYTRNDRINKDNQDKDHDIQEDHNYRHLLGRMAIFSSPSNAEAVRYLSKDPLTQDSSFGFRLYPMNIQDVDGLNHYMSKSFADQEILKDIHSMDPEDLLSYSVPVLTGLEDQPRKNEEVLESLLAKNISYRYTRWTLEDKIMHLYPDKFTREQAKERAAEITEAVRFSEADERKFYLESDEVKHLYPIDPTMFISEHSKLWDYFNETINVTTTPNYDVQEKKIWI